MSEPSRKKAKSNPSGMKVVITGGCGFLGQCLARAILRTPSLVSNVAPNGKAKVTQLVLADIKAADKFLFAELDDARVSVEVGDISSREFVDSLFVGDDVSIFHLSAIMSGQGETDFDLCMRVNLHGTLNVLEAARAKGTRPRVVFTSTMAIVGSGTPTDYVSSNDVISDKIRATPHTTYGMTKSCSELLMTDYSRRRFIDGRAVRLPTVIVRAGKPNAATTSCFSGIIREPLAGISTEMPLERGLKHAVCGYRMVIDALMKLHDAPTLAIEEMLGYDRTVGLPACPFSLGDLEEALLRVVENPSALGKITWKPDKFLSNVVGSFATKVDAARSLAFGVVPDRTPDDLIRQYVEDFPSSLGEGVTLRAPGDEEEKLAEGTKVVLITGGGSGIGRAAALAMAAEWREKVALVLAGRRKGALDAVAAETKAMGSTVLTVSADLTIENDIEALFGIIKQRLGRLDVLFNNAGISLPPTPIEDLSGKAWQKVVDINLNGVFFCTQHAVRLMKSQTPQGGRIINNGSISAERPRPDSAAYTATKHAVLGLTKSTSLDGRKYNIACGQIDIGNAKSSMTASMEVGMPQADGTMRPEPTFPVEEVGRAVTHMASLPLNANVLSMTIMASAMPFVGRG